MVPQSPPKTTGSASLFESRTSHKKLVSPLYSVHNPAIAKEASTVEAEASDKGMKQPPFSEAVPVPWKVLDANEAFAGASLAHLSAMECLSATAFTILKENLSPDITEETSSQLGA